MQYQKSIDNIIIDEDTCEGCSLCYNLCPHEAISLHDRICGSYFNAKTTYGDFVYARLGIAEEKFRKNLLQLLEIKLKSLLRIIINDLIIIDGSPGVGCPVIASITNTDLVLIVTEPSLSGLNDLERVLQLTKHF